MPQVSKNSKIRDFEAIALSVASPDDIYSWSYGEVTKPETINYRTQRAEMGGLFCERTFGPTKNFQCYCGKYKRVRYEGVVCERCGVEVTRNIVRRERMGHIKLAVPVTHIWYLRSTPSRLGLLLDLPVKQIEQVVYFAAYIVTKVDAIEKDKVKLEIEEEYKQLVSQVKQEHQNDLTKLKADKPDDIEKKIEELEGKNAAKLDELKEDHAATLSDLEALAVAQVLSEVEYRRFSMKFGHIFEVGIGAEGVREIIENIDLEQFIEDRKEDLKKTSGLKQKKIIKRLKLAANLLESNVKPEWMVLTVLPVIPPDLRPMVQLDGGRFAASDLNDLYRRVINRNNRLKRLLEIHAPEVICRNEKRMLQEAVDALLNSDARQGKTTFNVNERRKLRSLSDMLKGKQGRFRQNLLGKRVDYSGRSVIVVGPDLELHQCGLPKEMALKLFKPLVIGELMKTGLAYNLKNAERVITQSGKEVWDILEKVTGDRYVLLNRAPTLHRLGIQAFQPVLIEGKAIRIHPLVCPAFNADFDGDQMAVHLPLSMKAQAEAKSLISSAQNLLKPSSGNPVTTPAQDMILGAYYYTKEDMRIAKHESVFADELEAMRAYENEKIQLQQLIDVRLNGKVMETTIGRIMFNEGLPEGLEFYNRPMGKKDLSALIATSIDELGRETTVALCDYLKKRGFEAATISGLSMGYKDMVIPAKKAELLEDAEDKVRKISNYWYKGYISEKERYQHVVDLWLEVKKEVTKVMNDQLEDHNHIAYQIRSGARGSIDNLTQLAGMKGSVASPSGKVIELPIRSSLLEGFSILEFFIAAHSGRKGKADTALKTANAGYLTRKLVDSVQSMLIKEEDCGTNKHRTVSKKKEGVFGGDFESKVFGRTMAQDVVDTKTGEVLVAEGEMIDIHKLKTLQESDVEEFKVRAAITCETEDGVCQKCYGFDLGQNKEVEVGTAVGVIAAQSIGEPGTQLTMRTFHSGGVAGGADITMGLSRVEELFEARTPKTPATVSEIAGKVSLHSKKNFFEITVKAEEFSTDEYEIGNFKPAVKEGESIKDGQIIARSQVDKNTIKAVIGGKILEVTDDKIVVKYTELPERIYKVPANHILTVRSGDIVKRGAKLTEGHLDLEKNMDLNGVTNTQEYIINDVQTIYRSQGQGINDKHIEVVVKQMFAKVMVEDPGDSEFLTGDVVNIARVEKANKQLMLDGKRKVSYKRLLFGLTKVAMLTDSWLSSSSFQETIRVLVEASVSKQVDYLKGLKENVIIGKLIPTGENFYKKNALTNLD